MDQLTRKAQLRVDSTSGQYRDACHNNRAKCAESTEIAIHHKKANRGDLARENKGATWKAQMVRQSYYPPSASASRTARESGADAMHHGVLFDASLG